MKKIKSLPIILFILSLLAISLFSSSVMILWSKTNVCHSDIDFIVHHLDKLSGLFIGIIILLVFFYSIVSTKIQKVAKNDSNPQSEYFDFPNNIFFDYLKELFSRRILKTKVYKKA